MPSVEDRIVKIEFDNGQFQSQVSDTLAALAELNEGLSLDNTAEGSAALDSMGGAVDSVATHFTALGAIGFSIIESLTQGALGFVKNIGGKLLEPIFGGGFVRAKNIEQAKFMFEGLGIDVTQAMDSALKAVKGTAFGLDEAAKAAAQFGASGIKVGDDMTSALRGVAGAAALTGKGFTEIADIFAGSAGSGKVTNQDLLQFATRGLNAASAVAKVMGKTEQQVHEMATNGELDFKTFAAAMDKAFGQHATEANKTFTGALANMKAAFARLGASVIGPELVVARDVFNSFTPVIDNLSSALQPLILVFHLIGQTLGKEVVGILNGISFDNLKAAMPAITRGLGVLFGLFQKIKLIAIGAFQRIFPPGGESVIVKIAAAFEKFTHLLDFGAAGASKLYSIFSGLWAILSIGWTIVKELAQFIWDLGKAIVEAVGGDTVDGLAKVGEFLVGLKESLVDEGGIQDFFNVLREGLEIVVEWIGKFKDAITNMFGGFDKTAAGAVSDTTGRIGDRFKTLSALGDKIKGLWPPFTQFAEKVGDALGKAWDAISNFFDGLGEKIAGVLSSGAFSGALDALNTGLLAALTASIIHWIKNGFNIGVGVNVGVGGDLISKISATFDQLTNSLKALQLKIKSEAILKIAYAIGILTASVLVLSLIDSAALTKALTAMAVGFGQLMGAFAILTKLTLDPKSAASFDILAAGFIILGAAMIVLALAAKILASMSWEELAKGLGGILVLIGILTVAAKLLAKETGGMIAAGIGIGFLAVGLLLMATAVKMFGSLPLGDLAKGLIGIAVGLGIITIAVNAMPNGASMALTGLGLVGVGLGLIAMGIALKLFASMSWDEIGRGLVALGGGLALIAAAVNLMPGGMIPTGLGLVAIGIGLGFFAEALKVFGSMSWDEIARGLTGLAGSLIVLSIGVTAMSGALVGAIALGVVAASLIVLSGALKIIGKMSWDVITDGLLKLAAAIGGVALVALLLSPAVPLIFALGVALTAIGIAFAVFGAGAFLAAKAFQILASAGAAGSKNVKAALETIGESLSALGKGLAQGIIDTIQVFADGIGKLIPAFAKIIAGILTAIEKNLPKFMKVFQKLMDDVIALIYEYGPQFIDVGIFMLESFLAGIRENIGKLTDLVINIVLGFIQEFANREGELVAAGINILLSFVQGIADNISTVIAVATQIITTLITQLGASAELIVTAGAEALTHFLEGLSSNIQLVVTAATEVVTNFIQGLTDSAQLIIDAGLNLILTLVLGMGSNMIKVVEAALLVLETFLTELTNHVPRVAKAATDFIISVVTEMGKNGLRLINAGTDAIKKFLEGLGKKIPEIAGAALDFIINVLEGVRHEIDSHTTELNNAGRHLIGAILNGMTMGLAEKAGGVFGKIGDFVADAKKALKGPWAIVGDPYSLWSMGVVESIAHGMTMAFDADSTVEGGATGLVQRTQAVLNDSIATISDSLGDMTEFNPTITPVLDLTKIAQDAKLLKAYIPDGNVAANSLGNARAIVFSKSPLDDENSPGGNSGVTFQQTINSPTQLSTADIYKATRNQITIAKEELAVP